MNYLVMSRVIYALPFLIYTTLNMQSIVTNMSALPFFGVWGAIFCFSLFFYAISKKMLPLLLVQFVFVFEMFLYVNMAMTTGDYNFLLFIILSSFYTIESLRNNSLDMLFHILFLSAGFFFLYRHYGITPSNFSMEGETILILASPLLCRAIMSAMENKDVVVREIVKEKKLLVPTVDTNEINKMQQKVDFFRGRTRELKKVVDEQKRDKDVLASKYRASEIKFQKLYNSSLDEQKINREIAKSYFQLLANIRFDLSRSFDENIRYTIAAFQKIVGAKYVAVFRINRETEEIELIDSVADGKVTFDDNQFLGSPSVADYLNDSLESVKVSYQSAEIIEGLEGIHNIIYTPINQGENVAGIIAQAYGDEYKNNIHNFNLSLMMAYHLYTMFKNENLYRQTKDEMYVDGLTGIFNKKYLLDNMEQLFNNTYNYGYNLACVFIDVDYFKQVNDTYGHEEGDAALKFVVDSIQKNVRKSDYLFRYGGDEFVLFMANATDDTLYDLCKVVNADVREYGKTININGEDRHLSVSMGAKIYNPIAQNLKDAKDLLARADKALYQSKANGKGKLYIDKEA